MARKGLELHDRSTDLLEQLVDRLPADVVEESRILLFGGEVSLFIELLTAALLRRRVPITPNEYDQLRDLLFAPTIPLRHHKFVNNRTEVVAGFVVRDTLADGPTFAVIASELPGFDAFDSVALQDLRQLELVENSGPASSGSFDWVLLGWANGVLEMEINSTRHPDAWNAKDVHDLVYDLRIRDAIEDSLPQLSEDLRPAVEKWVAQYDRIYSSLTVDDSRRWVALKGQRRREKLNWWWYRIPASGPVVEEYRSYMAGFEEWRRKRDAESSAQEDGPM
ncbi:hypothetical protein ACIA8C_26680 [Nocardia sp. NPDC051321]|uniref:hypothetical protein n=1 Tax=Nocardia sp. NPDC051321 TaxID=3364323 RepID=UPI0037AF683D